MPPSVFYIFKKYLNLVRWNSPDYNEHIEEKYDVHNYATDDGSFSLYMQSSDYVHLLARNMVIIITTALVIGLVWLVFIPLDHLSLVKRNEWLRRFWFFRR